MQETVQALDSVSFRRSGPRRFCPKDKLRKLFWDSCEEHLSVLGRIENLAGREGPAEVEWNTRSVVFIERARRLRFIQQNLLRGA